MTLLDVSLESPFTLTDGKARLDTSVDAMLNAVAHPGLPHCAAVEFVSITLEDANGTPFAQVGTRLGP